MVLCECDEKRPEFGRLRRQNFGFAHGQTPRATWAGCREIFLINTRDNPAPIEPRNRRIRLSKRRFKRSVNWSDVLTVTPTRNTTSTDGRPATNNGALFSSDPCSPRRQSTCDNSLIASRSTRAAVVEQPWSCVACSETAVIEMAKERRKKHGQRGRILIRRMHMLAKANKSRRSARATSG
jgi:hypothetical protein